MAAIPSIRARLSRGMLVFAVLWSVAVTVVLYLVVQHEVAELLDNTLQESAEIIYGLLARDLGPLTSAQGAVKMPAPPHTEHLIWQVLDAHQSTVLLSHDAPLAPLLIRPVMGLSDVDDQWRVYGMAIESQPGWMLYVAQDLAERRELSLGVVRFAAGATVLIGLICVLWLRRHARRELEPVARLADAIRCLDPLATKASALPPAEREELEPMLRAIGELSARLELRVANERAFSAHAAHAMRTPLAGIDAQLAVALRESPPALRPRLVLARAAAARLQRVVAALLALFRSSATPHWQAFSIGDLAAQLSFNGLALVTEGADRLVADPDLLAAALMNLLDNAVHHGADRAWIRVSTPAEQVVLELHDNGSGIDPALRVRLQQALDSQAYEAINGLGLMLADRVARAHGGFIRLGGSDQGGLVTLCWPLRTVVPGEMPPNW